MCGVSKPFGAQPKIKINRASFELKQGKKGGRIRGRRIR
jgi:hypothetical protein